MELPARTRQNIPSRAGLPGPREIECVGVVRGQARSQMQACYITEGMSSPTWGTLLPAASSFSTDHKHWLSPCCTLSPTPGNPMLGTAGLKDDAGRAPHLTELITSEKEPCKSEHPSPRTKPVHKEQNCTDSDPFTRTNILAARLDKPVAKSAKLPVTEPFTPSSGKIITLGTRRPGRMLSVHSETYLFNRASPSPMSDKGKPNP